MLGIFYSYLVDAGVTGFLGFFGSNLCCHLFLLRFFLLCSGSLSYAGLALIVDLAALLRIFDRRRFQALADDSIMKVMEKLVLGLSFP